MNRLITILLALFCILTLKAQIQVQAPRQVAVGEQFRLQYTVATTDVRGFRAGTIPSDAFEVLMGPSTSTQQSYSIVNGQVRQSASVTYTYILSAVKNGTFTIGPAHAKVDGKDAASQGVKITVSGTVQQPQHQGNANRAPQQRGAQVRPAGSRISGNDLFIKVSANKQRVHEQEPILLTYKVYTQLELTQLEGKMPDLTGFHTQEIPLPQQKSFHIENVNGRPYRCVTWSQYVMFPQMTGKLEIPSITFKGIVVQEDPNVDPFEMFFNGGAGYIEVKRDIKAPSLTIMVDKLPEKPANFSGGVGSFNITASADKSTVKAGDPVKVHIVISGTGNLKLLKQPDITVPKDFDKYDPKMTDNTKLTANGLTGNVTYDILVVPRHQGKYEIPPVELVYFDPNTSLYKSVKTNAISLNVEKGNGRTDDVADYSRKMDSDIRSLHEYPVTLTEKGETFFGSVSYIILNALVFITFIALLVIFRKRALEHANVAGMRGKKANSVAGKRLKKAAKFMEQGKANDFYDEVLRAMWGYIADKFTMPVVELSRDNIAERLTVKNVEPIVTESLLSAIDECEFARYAPGDAAGNMQKTYDTAVTAITNIEDAMKHSKKKKTSAATDSYMRVLILMLVSACFTFTYAAEKKSTESGESNRIEQLTDDKAKADIAYTKGNYQEAIAIYEQISKVCNNAEVYYNLGNAYYRTSNYTQAIIAYEHSLLLSPGDEDVKHNLQVVRSKTADAIQPSQTIIFKEWFEVCSCITSIDGWARTSLISFVIALVMFLIYLFVSNFVVQKVSFFASLVFIVLFVIGNMFAMYRTSVMNDKSGAVITASSAIVKKTPNVQSADVCIIHDGTKVIITDSGMNGWLDIQLPDGREGWIQTNTVKVISID